MPSPRPGPAMVGGEPDDQGRPTQVHAIVLFWQAAELPLLERCVASLRAQRLDGSVRLRVIVVDNGCGATPSLGDPAESTVTVELVRLPENRGFCGGNNSGMERALADGTDGVFLVNSDVVLDPACVRTLVAAARRWPRAGALGPLVLREAEPDRVESAGQSFDRRTGRHGELGRGELADAVDPRPRRVSSVSGAALLATRQMVESIGMLDQGLFFYFEDMDWCLRAGRAGFDVLVVPEARVWHLGGGSTGPVSPRSTFYSVRNHAIVAARNARPPLAGPALGALVVGYHLAYLLRSPERRTRAHFVAFARGAWAAMTGRMGPDGIAPSKR